MQRIRHLILATLEWSIKQGFDLGNQIHHGWVLANSDRDVRF